MTKRHSFTAKILSSLTALVIISSSAAAFAETTTVPTTAPSSSAPTTAVSQQAQQPFLKAIEFTGAELTTPFKSDVYEYTLNVTSFDELDLKSYTASDPLSKVKFNYISNKSGAKKGIIITVEKDGLSRDYKFYYDDVYTVNKTSDATLSELIFNYGELSPEFKSDVFKYTLYLPSDLEVLTFEASASDSSAVINTPTEIKLEKDQTTPITIMVTSGDGTQTSSYKLNIKRVDKTLEQVKKEMADPNYVTFVEIPFYETATFYVIVLCSAFALALLIIIAVSVRRSKRLKSKKAAEESTEKVKTTAQPAKEKPEEKAMQEKVTDKKAETKPTVKTAKSDSARTAPPAPVKPAAKEQTNAESRPQRKQTSAVNPPVAPPKPAQTAYPKQPVNPVSNQPAVKKTETKPSDNKDVKENTNDMDWLGLDFDLSKYDNYNK